MATTAFYSSATVTTSASTTLAESTLVENETMTSKYEQQQEEAIQKMKSNLIRYTRANDRRMVLRSLKDVKFLSFIPLPPPITSPPEVPLADLEQQVAAETLVLNNFTIKPAGAVDKKKGMHTGLNSGPPILLQGLANSLCESSNPSNMDGKTLYETLIIRMAKTTASADPYLQLNSLLGSSTDLMVMQLSPEHHKTTTPANYIVPSKSSSRISATIKTNDSGDSSGSGGSKNQHNQVPKNLIHLNLFVSNGEVHITLDMAFEFGLFRRSDVKPNRPWIALRAEVHERANLSTGQSYRTMAVRTPDLY
jgi:hypothetical protein